MTSASVLHGFVLEREATLQEYHTVVHLWRHQKTGARYLSLCNKDDNKVFAVTFRTPPKDSTGVAHILEHSVLCGSRKYPVKEPFVELMKGSLQTFLNAFTYPDKTCYPVASTHAKDFYNLMDVYLDAVFFPRITREIFMQEGWHLARPEPQEPLQFKGVVYNEMKGAYSSPDSVFREIIQHSLYPDTLYSLDSGGDPAVIPQLTYDAFKDFHARYYHPSNAYFFGYGDDPEDERLRRVAEYLDQFEPLAVDSAIPLQPPFAGPRRIEDVYAAGEEGGQKAFFCCNWLLGETLPEGDTVAAAAENLAWNMLDELLVGLPGAPLRQALLDSGLGEDLAGGGLEAELRQMFFSTGLKGIEPENAQAVETLILDTLTDLVEQGFPPEYVAAAVNSVEFDLRENNTGSYPRGLNLMLRALSTWLYDKDPLALLAFEAPLAHLKARLARGERVFEEMIRTHLLANPARTAVLLTPDPTLAERRSQEEASRLATMLETLRADNPNIEDDAARDAARLEALQAMPDDPAQLATIPHLLVADLPRENQILPIAEQTMHGVPVCTHALDTAGVVYLDLGFHLDGLGREALALVPLFGRALVETGTAQRDFISLAMHISATTGGIDPATFAGTRLDTAAPAQLLFLRGKATVANHKAFFDILREVLLEATLADQERIRQLVLEEKAQMEESLAPAGHAIVVSRLRAGLNAAGQVAEVMGGLEQLHVLRRLAEQVESDWPAVREALFHLRNVLLHRANLLVNITAEADALAAMEPALARLLAALPAAGAPQSANVFPLLEIPAAEALCIPSQVNFVGLGIDCYGQGLTAHGSLQLAARFVRSGYLWEKIRVQGGAYGAFCFLDRLSGALNLVSYRDPNVERTLDAFLALGDWLATLDLTPAAMDKAILGAINEVDAYLLPDAKGYIACLRRLTNDTNAGRQRMREEILAATVEDLRRLGRFLQQALPQGRLCVIGSRQTLEPLAQTRHRGRDWTLQSLL
ncbi:insulinase family protein [Megalodesulfovibrio gigas]|uniref:Putative peptidase M16C n=1 Tax=Megalodesulfovibrio gigas (strain ATCC 19364 / DSM 1382 / NCIMB 9332 / VKM B-1759) TaxID=1121448 RepID=T2GBE6_MEGG1|nr:insulinase family protein [Megalodesulfovibrio gigas]AGW13456.1 putative peptidase M16C [Megalodesulfovibrio gigas DSM 1382 = ATCC 19364]